MSIGNKAGIVYGWAFSGMEYANFNRKTNNEFEDDFIILDPYYGDSCNRKALFGIWLESNPNVGTAREFIPYTMNDISGIFNYAEWRDKFLAAGYDPKELVNNPPKFYIVNQIY